MEGKSYFLKKKGGVIFLALLASLSGVIGIVFQQNAYPLTSGEARTNKMEKVITIENNGDVRFQENLSRYFSTQVFFQDIYSTSDHEDIPKNVSTPAFDTTRFSTEIYNTNTLLTTDGLIFSSVVFSGKQSYVISGYEGISKDIILPTTFNNLDVVGISAEAFSSKGITSITFSETIKFIGNNAFSNNQLTMVRISSGVTNLGNNAFSNNILIKVTIPNSVETIGFGAFSGNPYQTIYTEFEVKPEGWNQYWNGEYFYGNVIWGRLPIFSFSYDQHIISSVGEALTGTYQGNNLILGYSWDPNSRDELNDPIEPIDPESVAWFHYNSGTWGDIRIENDYWINGVALKYADTAEFFWVIAATDGMQTENIDVKVVLPGINLDVDLVDAYINGSSLASIHHIGVNESGQTYVHIKADRLYPDEYITTRINFPADRLMIDTTQDNLYGNDVSDYAIANGKTHLENVATYEAERAAFRQTYQMVDILGISILVIVLAFSAWKIRDIYLKYDKEHPTDFYGEYYRELPAQYGPAIMGYLYRFKEVAKDDVTATLMDLIRRKFIILDAGTESLTEAKVNYVMKLNKEADQTKLLAHEKQLIQWFFGLVAGGDTLSLNQLEAFTKKENQAIRYMNENQSFNRAVVSAAQSESLFDNVKEPAQKNGAILGLTVLLGIGFMITRYLLVLGSYTGIVGGILFGLSMIIGSYLNSIERRSKKGNEDYVRWKAFEKFLKEFTNIKDYPMPGMTIWEHYMVYATAFGIADLVEKQIRFKYQQLNQTSELNKSSTFRYPGFYLYSNRMMSRSFVSAQQTISQAQAQRNNSSGRGGGGFGGGGGFRGGGGSGVRIR